MGSFPAGRRLRAPSPRFPPPRRRSRRLQPRPTPRRPRQPAGEAEREPRSSRPEPIAWGRTPPGEGRDLGWEVRACRCRPRAPVGGGTSGCQPRPGRDLCAGLRDRIGWAAGGEGGGGGGFQHWGAEPTLTPPFLVLHAAPPLPRRARPQGAEPAAPRSEGRVTGLGAVTLGLEGWLRIARAPHRPLRHSPFRTTLA